MEQEDAALQEAHANPQANACLGITIFSGVAGIFFGVFPSDLRIRIIAAAICFLMFAAAVFGHGYFKRKESQQGFRASQRIRYAIGFGFSFIPFAASSLAIYALNSGLVLSALFLVAYALCLVPFAYALSKDREKEANRSAPSARTFDPLR